MKLTCLEMQSSMTRRFNKGHIMRCNEHGHAHLLKEFKDAHDLCAKGGVQVPRGLICEQDGRP